MLLILLVASFPVVSCKAKQPLKETEKEVKETEKETKETDKTVVNKEILDKILFQIGLVKTSNPDCDSLVNFYREELARNLTAFKQSGDNSYELKYNEALKRLEFIAKIGKTENKEVIKHTIDKTTYTLQKTKEVPVHFMEWWEKLFMRVGMTCTALIALFVAFLIIKNKIA